MTETESSFEGLLSFQAIIIEAGAKGSLVFKTLKERGVKESRKPKDKKQFLKPIPMFRHGVPCRHAHIRKLKKAGHK